VLQELFPVEAETLQKRYKSFPSARIPHETKSTIELPAKNNRLGDEGATFSTFRWMGLLSSVA
jgi:hypothetical protein